MRQMPQDSAHAADLGSLLAVLSALVLLVQRLVLRGELPLYPEQPLLDPVHRFGQLGVFILREDAAGGVLDPIQTVYTVNLPNSHDTVKSAIRAAARVKERNQPRCVFTSAQPCGDAPVPGPGACVLFDG